MLELSGLQKTFGETRAVDGVSFRVHRGEMVGIIGRSGSGKSTLMRLINRLCEPTSGEVFFEKASVTGLKGKALRSWRRRCAMVFQQFNLVPRLDVITNVLVGSLAERDVFSALAKQFPPELRARAILELDALGMANVALQRAGTLSGGQQQRVAIARAMMQRPDVLLADEPISSLDPINADLVMNSLKRLNQDRNLTVVVNLHSLDIARRYCSRVIGMASGRVVFDGAPALLDDSCVDRIYASGAGDRQSNLAALEQVAV
ncbi:MAG: phosphonate ABC transporter ATP-binding protein [Hyphomonadaceae bacterium]|nr:phosphonate ABC transporter ATP-binding protein [Hyphomonadaceae bacterium]